MDTWKTKEGRIVRIDDMCDSHVENALNLILKQGGIGIKRVILKLIVNEQKRIQSKKLFQPNGEMAQLDADRAMEDYYGIDQMEDL